MKYRVILQSGAWQTIDVEADSIDEAIDKAHGETSSLCAHCTGWGKDGVSMELGEEWKAVQVDVWLTEDEFSTTVWSDD
jgi:hypothetical protein